MSDTNTIVEFPKAHLDAAMSDGQAYKSKGMAAFAGKQPAWRFDREFVTNSHFDASESMYVARQLEHIRAGVYEVQYTDTVYDRLLPINRAVTPGQRSYIVRILDKVGEAVILDESADQGGNVEEKIREIEMGFFPIGIGYSYVRQEILSAMEAGVPLQANKALLAKQLMERKVDQIALIGDAKAPSRSGGQKGILNTTDSGILTYTASSSSGAGTTNFDKFKSADEILEDLHGMVSKPWTSSQGLFSVNTLCMPLTTRTYLASRRVGDGTNGSILDYFLGSDQFINSADSVIGLWHLEDATAAGTAGSWTGKRMMAYRRDPSCLEFLINQDFEQLPPQAVNYRVHTLCRMSLGGLALYQPLTMIRMDGV
jgi:hypothetical protein